LSVGYDKKAGWAGVYTPHQEFKKEEDIALLIFGTERHEEISGIMLLHILVLLDAVNIRIEDGTQGITEWACPVNQFDNNIMIAMIHNVWYYNVEGGRHRISFKRLEEALLFAGKYANKVRALEEKEQYELFEIHRENETRLKNAAELTAAEE